ncbi:MAG: hypothetical protein V2I76_00355 [Roseobacter sp.]|jgi:hypothetical protein|nr:hypothetical protein [Roseobacter sp.]
MKQSTDVLDTPRVAGNDLSLAYVLDPRFPGGTSSAVAAELKVVTRLAKVRVHALETKMFPTRRIAPQLNKVLRDLNLELEWDADEIAADLVILHNPSCLKFQESIGTRIIARHLIVVTHENFLRPGGAPAFDVAKCLGQIASASISLQRSLAPVSTCNRETIERWYHEFGSVAHWELLEDDWFNICSFEKNAPTTMPRDRRGRHSRAGAEKFPSRDVMAMCFPATAESNVILGADSLLRADDVPKHWDLYPFGGLTLESFFKQIDFFVYFTATTWRESFGRVIAEAIAAGKIVITDPETASTFMGAAIGAAPEDVDRIIAGYIAEPERYCADVASAQDKLDRFSADAFEARFGVVACRVSGTKI